MTVAGYIKSIKRLLPLRTHLQLVVLIYNSLPPICLNSSFFSSVCYEVLYKRIKNRNCRKILCFFGKSLISSPLTNYNILLNLHLCPGLNAVTSFANFVIFRFSLTFDKFCDFSLNSTRYTKICFLDDFSIRCAKIYNFMLIDQQAAACGFYKIYDFSTSYCEICNFLHFFVMQIPPTSADLRN